MLSETKNKGVLPPPINPKEYVFGNISGIVHENRNTTSDWRLFKPTDERQNFNMFDDHGCASRSMLNSAETQFEFLKYSKLLRQEDIEWLEHNGYIDKNGKVNFDDRWLVLMSDTIPGVGNYLHKTWDAARRFGLVPQGLIPFDENWSQARYYNKSDFPKQAYDLGQEFLKRFITQYERVPVSELAKALKHAPIQVGIPTCPGWKNNTKVNACTMDANHATLLVNIDSKTGEKTIIDSYFPYEKILPKNYNVDFAYKGVVSPITSVSGEKKERFIFEKNLEFGDRSNDVTQLCRRLIEEDLLSNYYVPSPHYGVEVRDGVLKYQRRWNITSWWENYVTVRGKYVGPKTRKNLNEN